MKAILTSYLGGSIKAGGKRIPIPLMDENGQLDKIKAFWRENSKILLISGTPDDYGRNDGRGCKFFCVYGGKILLAESRYVQYCVES